MRVIYRIAITYNGITRRFRLLRRRFFPLQEGTKVTFRKEGTCFETRVLKARRERVDGRNIIEATIDGAQAPLIVFERFWIAE